MSKNLNNSTTFVFSNEFVGYTAVYNYILNDNRLSYKALGLYCQILQFQNSPNHSLYQKTLVNLKTDGKASVSAGITELIKYGYLVKTQLKNEKGLYCGVQYTVYMKPIEVKKEEKEEETEPTENIENLGVSSESRKSDFRKTDFRKQDPNNKINKNKIYNNIDNNDNINIIIDNQRNDKYSYIANIINKLSFQKSVMFKGKKLAIKKVIEKVKEKEQELETILNKTYTSILASSYTENIKDEEKYVQTVFLDKLFYEEIKNKKTIEEIMLEAKEFLKNLNNADY